MNAAKVKQVKFSGHSQLFLVSDLLKGMEREMLYSVDEFELLKAQHLRSILIMRVKMSTRANASRSGDLITSSYILGIEKYLSDELSIEYKQCKRVVFLTLKVEQQRQVFLGRPDPDRLAAVSCRYSQWAIEKACAAAICLQQDLESSSSTDAVQTNTIIKPQGN